MIVKPNKVYELLILGQSTRSAMFAQQLAS